MFVCPVCPPEGCLSSAAGGTGFPGLGEGSFPEILSHLSREIPYDQPMLASYSGRRCPCIFVPA